MWNHRELRMGMMSLSDNVEWTVTFHSALGSFEDSVNPHNELTTDV